jgi:hypothetical protein
MNEISGYRPLAINVCFVVLVIVITIDRNHAAV